MEMEIDDGFNNHKTDTNSVIFLLQQTRFGKKNMVLVYQIHNYKTEFAIGYNYITKAVIRCIQMPLQRITDENIDKCRHK